MSGNSRPQPAKRPVGGRQIRRFFSRDNLPTIAKSNHGRKASAESSVTGLSVDESAINRVSTPFSPVAENSIETDSTEPWLDKKLVSTPVTPSEYYDETPGAESPNPTRPPLPYSSSSSYFPPVPAAKQPKATFDTLPARSTSPTPSTSRARWDHLRHHVLPTSRSASPNPSFASFSQLNLATGAATAPRPHRLAARFGFRQVVTEAREAVAIQDDLMRKFAEEVQRACLNVRFGDNKRPKPEREATQHTLGSTLHLPFMSSTTLPISAAASMNDLSLPGPSKLGPRGAAASTQPTGRLAALTHLQDVIIRYASAVFPKDVEQNYLPREKDVLSVTLIAFLNQSTGHIAEDERRISFQIFKTVIQSWKALPDGEVERCVWCCKALTMPPSPLRSRLLDILDGLISAQESPLSNIAAMQTVMARLALLTSQYCFNRHESLEPNVDHENDTHTVESIVKKIIKGGCGKLDIGELEHHYNTGASNADSEDDLRSAICIEAIVRCLDFGSLVQKRKVLHAIDQYWIPHDDPKASTPLSIKVHSRKIDTFLKSILEILYEIIRTGSSSLESTDVSLITRLLNTRVMLELEAFGSTSQSPSDTRALLVKVVLALLSVEVDIQERNSDPDDTFADPKIYESKHLLMDWLEGGSTTWRDCIHKELREFGANTDWACIVHIAHNVTSVLPDSTSRNIIALMIPQMQERLVRDPPPHPNGDLTHILSTFAATCPQVFYKPLFQCASSSKDEVVAANLAILIWLGQFIPTFWISDPEMIAVALMSDPGGGAALIKQKGKEGQPPEWGKARVGQMMIFLEVILKLRAIRLEHAETHEANVTLATSLLRTGKFAAALETRLAILIEAKEQTMLMPLLQRILLAALFLEIRLVTRVLKSTSWLSRMVTWTTQFTVQETDPSNSAYMTQEILDEVEALSDRIETIYTMCSASMKPANQRRSTMVLSPNSNGGSNGNREDIYESLMRTRRNSLKKATDEPLGPFLELLVAMCGALKHEDLARLGPFVWNECLDIKDEVAVINACFLCMQSAEKAHDSFIDFLLRQLQSDDVIARRDAIKRLSILGARRYQLLSVTYITDRSFRRPFKLARPPLNFVATDVGDSKYIPDDEVEEGKLGQSSSLPLDLKRRLNEIGWDEEDKPQDQSLQWLRTPMSLLGVNQLYELSATTSLTEDLSDAAPSPLSSPRSSPSKSPEEPKETQLLRRNSSSSGHGVKRRSVFVQPLIPVFITLARLTMDQDFLVSSMAKDVIADYMREDPVLLSRPIMDVLSGNIIAIDEAVTTLRALLHVQHILPPRLTHHIFNHLAGFLKWLAKEQNPPEALRDMAYVVGILAKFGPQVSDMSVRAIRRGKIEVFLFPSGSLYFGEGAPPGPLFPRGPVRQNDPFEEMSPIVANMSMVRMSQSLLFVDLLKRSPQDVLIVRKSWSPLELPEVAGLIEGGNLPQRSLVKTVPQSSQASFRLSLSYSRSHLLFVAQLLRCLTRHLSDRSELQNYLDGVNEILRRHGNDIAIVAHALIVYMIASTRFRRLMSSGTGFTIFLPTLFKVYCEAEGDPGIREAIEYAFQRFYAFHEETFVYQALQVISAVVARPCEDNDWIASNAYHLLYSLKSTPPAQDAAGIHDVNKMQEEETALAISADERPQVFLASLRKDSKGSAEKIQSSISAEFLENKRFQPENIIKMLLTVIAHDPLVKRAEHFIRLFRFLTPHLYNASASARSVLRDGIDALGNIVTNKMVAKVRAPDPVNVRGEKMSLVEDEKSTGATAEKSAALCDIPSMRSDFLLLFVAYAKIGGNYRSTTLLRAFDLTKQILRESSASSAGVVSIRDFMDQLAQTFVSREDPKYTVSILKELAPIVSAHGGILDLTGLLKSLVTLSSNPKFANDEKFSRIVVNQICSSVLEVCEMAAQENILSTLKFRNIFVHLLARSVCLSGTDIFADLETREPSPAFLSGIMLPFIFRLSTSTEFSMETQWTDNWRQDAHARAWPRLFAYAMKAFQSPLGGNAKGSIKRSPSIGADDTVDADTSKLSLRKPRRQRSGPGNVAGSVHLAMAFVTLKAVILRGEEDISALLPSAWSAVGALLRSKLRDGGALFAFRGHVGSVTPSPMPSPVASMSFGEMMNRSNDGTRMRSASSASEVHLKASSTEGLSASNRTSRPASPFNTPIRQNSVRSFPCPRFVDYLTWSILEFICLRRGPLIIQLRTYMNERLLQLHELLHNADLGGYVMGEIRTRRASRPISTMYTKPRLSIRASSMTVTPEGSPRFGPADLANPFIGNSGSIPSMSSLGTPEFNPSPSSPRLFKGRKPILHLGTTVSPAKSLLSPSFLPQSTSANSNLLAPQAGEDAPDQFENILDVRQTLVTTEIRSASLARMTYERVRTVQKFCGYVEFLPLPKSLTKPGFSNTRRNINQMAVVDSPPVPGGHSPRNSFVLGQEPGIDPEPEARVWTKRGAADAIMAEAKELMHAWQVEATIVTSISDNGHGDGTLSARASTEEAEATFVYTADAGLLP